MEISKRTATETVTPQFCDRLFLSIPNASAARSWPVDDAFYSLLAMHWHLCLTLRIVEISRHGDDRFGDFSPR